MRCMNCGLPLSPARTITNCPRCGASTNTGQGVQQQSSEQGGWDNMAREGAFQGNPWATDSTPPPNSFAQQGFQNQMEAGSGKVAGFNAPAMPGFQEPPFSPRRPYPPQKNTKNSQNLFMIAGLCVAVGALLLVLILVLGSGNSSPSTANINPTTQLPTATPTLSNPGVSPTVSASPSPNANGTTGPAQQYITSAEMAKGVDNQTMQPVQATTTFTVGSNMYVIFTLHPPSQGGAVCSLWYLNGKQITFYSFTVSGISHASYTYANYSSAGTAYVELYWASDKTCADKVLAQHVDFTVTAS